LGGPLTKPVSKVSVPPCLWVFWLWVGGGGGGGLGGFFFFGGGFFLFLVSPGMGCPPFQKAPFCSLSNWFWGEGGFSPCPSTPPKKPFPTSQTSCYVLKCGPLPLFWPPIWGVLWFLKGGGWCGVLFPVCLPSHPLFCFSLARGAKAFPTPQTPPRGSFPFLVFFFPPAPPTGSFGGQSVWVCQFSHLVGGFFAPLGGGGVWGGGAFFLFLCVLWFCAIQPTKCCLFFFRWWVGFLFTLGGGKFTPKSLGQFFCFGWVFTVPKTHPQTPRKGRCLATFKNNFFGGP